MYYNPIVAMVTEWIKGHLCIPNDPIESRIKLAKIMLGVVVVGGALLGIGVTVGLESYFGKGDEAKIAAMAVGGAMMLGSSLWIWRDKVSEVDQEKRTKWWRGEISWWRF